MSVVSTGNIRFLAKTHVGLVRQINEDAILSLPEHGIWLVADGLGGHDAGEFASQTVVNYVAALAMEDPSLSKLDALRGAIAKANTAIEEEAFRRKRGPIGTTVVALLIANDYLTSIWAGDSRLYRLRSGHSLELLTTDHSYMAQFVLNGDMSWDEAEQYPQSNLITRAVGLDETVELDEIHHKIQPGDRFLLCSDGLSKYATFPILSDLMSSRKLESLPDDLMQIALEGGADDNISLIVVDVN